jgi:hypothetical protein
MSINHKNIINILTNLSNGFYGDLTTISEATYEELDISEKLFTFMQKIINEYNYEESDSEELEFENNNNVEMETDCEWVSSEEFTPEKFRESKEYLPLQYMKKVI